MSSPPRQPPRAGGRAAPDSPGDLHSSEDPPYVSDVEEGDPAADAAGADDDDEEEGEDLYGEGFQRDYMPIARLDNYDDEEVASDEDVDMDYEQLRAAERAIARRAEEEARRGMRSSFLHRHAGEDDAIDLDELRRARAAMRAREDSVMADALADEQVGDAGVSLEEIHGPVSEFLTQESTKAEIRRQFSRLLRLYSDTPGAPALYIAAIERMIANNKQSLSVSYSHITTSSPGLGRLVVEHPDVILPLLHHELAAVTETLSPGYSTIKQDVFVRVYNMPLRDSIRELRHYHVNCLIRVAGVAVRRSGVFPQLSVAHYVCSCGERLAPMVVSGLTQAAKPTRCPACQNTNSIRLDATATLYRNYQRVTLQESPGSVPAGRVPRQVEVVVLNDLIDMCAPGEEIEVTGIYKHAPTQALSQSAGFPIFTTILEANHIAKAAQGGGSLAAVPTPADEAEILRLSRMPQIDKMIINSIAPSIHGHDHIKTSIALALFGGVPKENDETHQRLRGDINVLLLGDPGTAKSQFLKYTQKVAGRSVYTTGKGASAVGLTAAVRMDPMSHEWTLEGGAMVLSDQGVCLIDEFDKMGDQDRTSIHEAMEQQTISVAKAGIVCTLKARCSVIAAANPIGGRYNAALSFQEQVNLTEPILSRFDVLCVVTDEPDREKDRRLAFFVANSHRAATAHASGAGAAAGAEAAGAPDPGAATLAPATVQESTPEERAAAYAQGMIPQDILRKYIAYARRTCEPTLENISNDYIKRFYGDLRLHAHRTGGVQITLRQVAGILRLSEAHAKMFLRKEVNDGDVRFAVKTVLTSFISTQKRSVQVPLSREFTPYLIDGIDRFEVLRDALISLRDDAITIRSVAHQIDLNEARGTPVELDYSQFRARAQSLRVSNYDDFLSSQIFRECGFTYNRESGKIVCDNRVV